MKIEKPADVIAWLNENTRTDESPKLIVFGCKQVGQMLLNAMNSEEGYQSFAHTADEEDVYSGNRFEWRELAERLRSKNG
jgi:hypothetical protein